MVGKIYQRYNPGYGYTAVEVPSQPQTQLVASQLKTMANTKGALGGTADFSGSFESSNLSIPYHTLPYLTMSYDYIKGSNMFSCFEGTCSIAQVPRRCPTRPSRPVATPSAAVPRKEDPSLHVTTEEVHELRTQVDVLTKWQILPSIDSDRWLGLTAG